LIDIHSHVLWGLDDGAPTLEDSIAMVRMAAEHGTTDLVATPHANPVYKFDAERIGERLAELQAAVGDKLHLYTGCDFHLSYDNIQDAILNPRKYTINGASYLLVEFSDLLVFSNTREILGHLLQAGMTPVITHPERNGLLRQRVDAIAEWVEAGTRVQVTAQSLLGDFGRRARDFCKVLLDRGLVHFVASDAHDCQRRPPVLDQARQWLTEAYGEELAEALLVTNPHAVLTGDPLELHSREVPPQPRKWYQIWRRSP
jgi:protein-tyrosine phosphatase